MRLVLLHIIALAWCTFLFFFFFFFFSSPGQSPDSDRNTHFLLYGLECYSLTVADVKSLDFTVICVLTKLFKSSNMDMTVYCALNFHYLVN